MAATKKITKQNPPAEEKQPQKRKTNAGAKAGAGAKTSSRADLKTKANTKTGTKTNAKKSTKKKSSSRSVPKAASREETYVYGDIVLLFFLAAAILLLISEFGVGGFIGKSISSVSFGLMGYLSYVFPFVLFLGTAFLIANKGNLLAYKKIGAAFLLFVCLCAFTHLLTEGYEAAPYITDYYEQSSNYHTGGGLVGGAVSYFLATAFGVAGAYVILTAVLIVCLVILTQRSFVGFVRRMLESIVNAFQSGIEQYQADAPEREKRAMERRSLREARRQERWQEEREEELREIKRRREQNRRRQDILNPKKGFLEGTKLTLPELSDVEPDRKEETEDIEKALSTVNFPKREEKKKEVPELKIQGMRQLTQDLSEEEEEEELPFEKDFVPKEPEEETSQPASKSKPQKSSQKEIQDGIKNIEKEMQEPEPEKKVYEFPPLSLLKKGGNTAGDSEEHLRKTAAKLQDTLKNFGVNVTVTDVSCGPTVTRYELHPEQGVKVSRIVSLTDDIKLNLAAPDIRIEAPIPGKAAVGIEVPNKTNSPVMLRDLLQSDEFQNSASMLSFAAGKDIGGQPVVADIAKMPHLLIAGATGSGKSVCINTLIMSILYKASPDKVKLIMIDPKVVELSVYNGIPHLFIPVVTDPKKAAGALNWAVQEMTSRYNTFAEFNVRGLADYNRKVSRMRVPEGEKRPEELPQIVIIVDELADLMMVAPGEVEDAICRLAQLARAAGIHLVIATQRPSVNVITGLIKANMPSRIAFSVSSGVDSRTILDMNGAEKLLGKGDMLFYPQGYQKPARVQGAFVSDEEVSAVVEFLANQNPSTGYSKEIEKQVASANLGGGASSGNERDSYFVEAGKFIIDKDKASIGMLQRMFKIGFNRAARIMDQLAEAGVVGPEEGTKPRKILMTPEEFENYIEENL
ncbi:MAG: DNA translocase FtsK [Eubacteriales bacterium]|nr:DNA translocase FtsK [Eubacteriales bacterium]